MPSRYQPLADFLAAQPPKTIMVTLTLPEIEQIVGPLPATAGTRTWWTNTASSPQARAWMAAGWRTRWSRFRPAPARVSFVRSSLASTL